MERTEFSLVQNHTEFCLVQNHFENGKYNIISVNLTNCITSLQLPKLRNSYKKLLYPKEFWSYKTFAVD